jgi:hypothetical protein
MRRDPTAHRAFINPKNPNRLFAFLQNFAYKFLSPQSTPHSSTQTLPHPPRRNPNGGRRRRDRRRSHCLRPPDGDPRLQVSCLPAPIYFAALFVRFRPCVNSDADLVGPVNLAPVTGVTSARAAHRSMIPTWLRFPRRPPRPGGGPRATIRGSGAR